MPRKQTAKKKNKQDEQDNRPQFLIELGEAYSLRRKNIIILTGDVNGLFYSGEADNYVSLEQVISLELKNKFNLVRMDISRGIGFYDKETEEEVTRICESIDGYYTPAGRIKALKGLIESTKYSPLQALVLLQGMDEAFGRVRRLESHIKPMCVILQYAGALFTAGDYSRLSELERQYLICFLSWVSGPLFRESPELIILINSVRTEINAKITALPHAQHLEIDLPGIEERSDFVDYYDEKMDSVRFSHGKKTFVEDTAGLSLHNILDLMEVGSGTGETIERQHVVKEVNNILQAQLGDIIRIKYPSHTPKDIVGYKNTAEIFTDIFARCEDPETAVAAILVSGPNGSGKTFQLEAYAAESGRVVVELAGIRGSYFGETDRFFELLRWNIATFGKILILVDEAHTAFGSVHSGQTHQTEQRLSGNIIKMMGDPRYFGKVLWGLMTSRPDELDPDIKSRAPVQVPIFDLEGEERQLFVQEMFKRKKIQLLEEELNQVLTLTNYYSARDYRNLVAEVLAQRRQNSKITIMEVLTGWQASKSIKRQREFQEMIAALHCSYPKLLPERYRDIPDEVLMQKVENLKSLLLR